MISIQKYSQKISQNHWLNKSNNDCHLNPLEIIVPVYNGCDSLINCTQSLLAYTSNKIGITFLNDASTDKQVIQHLDSLDNQYHHIKVIHRETNLGYLHNLNHYLSQCNGDVLLLNADTEVTPNWLNEMLKVAADNRVGVVCPVSDNATLLSLKIKNTEILKHLSQFSNQWYPIPTAVGFCMLIKQNVLSALGGFDSYYHPGYGEECDYSMRVRNTGLQVACSPAAFVFHKGSQSFLHKANTLLQQHQKLLDLRYPNYMAEINSFQASNPIQFVEQSLAASTKSKPRMLHVVHGVDNKGGVELFTKGLLEQLNNEFQHTLLIPKRHPKFKHQALKIENCDVIEIALNLSRPNHLVFNTAADPYHSKLDNYFRNLLSSGQFDLVKFHSLVNVGSAIWPMLCHQLNIPYQIFFHDHYGLCQIYCLATSQDHDQQQVYCGKTSYDATNQCLQCISNKTQKSSLTTASLMTLRTEIWQHNIEHADHIYFPSEYLQRIYATKHKNILGKSTVFSPCFYPSSKTPLKAFDRSKITIAFLGQFGPLKGAQLFIDLYSALNKPEIHWKIIGGIDPAYQNILNQSSIELTGSYETSQLSKQLKDVDLIVFTTQLPETYAITLTEAWGNGIPVIAPKIGAFPERITNSNNGLLYQPNDLNSLTQTVEQWIDSSHSSDRMIEFKAAATDRIHTLSEKYQQALSSKKVQQKSVPSHYLLPKPPANAYQLMLKWLDSPMTLEAEADWKQLPDSLDVLIWGQNESLCQLTALNLKQFIKSPNIYRIQNLNSDWPSNLKQDSVLLIEEGTQINENFGNWLHDFTQQQAPISLADYALCNQRQQIYAAQFQNRFSWVNYKLTQHHVGCMLIKTKHLITAHCSALIRSASQIKHLINEAYKDNPKNISHFPHFTYTVNDVVWAEKWKHTSSSTLQSETKQIHQTNPRLLIYVESNKNANHFTTELLKQTVFKQGQATLVCFNSTNKNNTLIETDHQSFELVMLLNDNTYFTNDNCLQVICDLLCDSSLGVLSPAMPNRKSKQSMVAKKWGAQNHFAGIGCIKNTLFDRPNAVTEYDLLDDDCMLFKTSVWQAVLQKVASNADHFLPLKLPSWLEKLNVYSGLCQLEGFKKKGLPSSGLNPNIPDLPIQRKTLIENQQHFPLSPVYSTAYSCRLNHGLDLNICSFKTPKYLPRVIAYAHDQWASGFYRIKSPLSALAAANKISTLFLPDATAQYTATPYEIHRLDPDVLLLHHFYSDQQLAALIQYRKQLDVPIVLGADDLLTDIPQYSDLSSKMPKDVETRIKLACSLADTLIVSTDYLADKFNKYHGNIRIIPNRLSKTVWQHLINNKPSGDKLRVGWAGAGQHQGDLDFLKPIIEATHRYCDWVFFGDKPKNVAENMIEFHRPVDLLHYPKYLSMLGIDVAVAPLVDNPFNQAKTNLKLLEYGVLGLPVIASDLNCYQKSPANLQPNQANLWVNELKNYHQNKALIEQDGATMKQWVTQNYWLEEHLDEWVNGLKLT